MADKDIAEKILESYNDVFADIINVFVFNGRQVVKSESLRDALLTSQYKMDGKLREQERDVAKFWDNKNIRLVMLGLENQSIIDKDITIDSCFLNNLDSIELRQIFNNQYSYIGITLENKPQINPDMYKSILFNIFYESSKENDLIINKLDILDGNTDLSELTKLSIFIKYLVVDKNVSHPYHIYNILLLLKSEIYGINTTNFNRYKRIAINNRVVSPIYVMNIFKEFLLYYNVYIEKLKVIFK